MLSATEDAACDTVPAALDVALEAAPTAVEAAWEVALAAAPAAVEAAREVVLETALTVVEAASESSSPKSKLLSAMLSIMSEPPAWACAAA